jgi:WD40 repeat protein
MGIYLGSLDHPDQKTLVVEATTAGAYAQPHANLPGHLLWVRNDALVAQPFDPDRAQLSGEPAVIPGAAVSAISALSLPNFSVSNQGTLIFGGQNDQFQLAWLSRDGKVLSTVGRPDRYAAIRLSPDGTRAALSVTAPSGNRDVWDMDLARGVPSRLTRDGGNVAVWSPDGRQLAYHDALSSHLWAIGVDGDHRLTLAESKGLVYVNDWSPDGRFVMYTGIAAATGDDLWLVPATGGQAPVSMLSTPFNESHGQFSPDGQWIAYTSDESGLQEIYVRSMAGKASTRVSKSGGSFSRWRKDGRELFYRSLDGRLMAVSIGSSGGGLTFGPPVALIPIVEPLGTFAYPYDVAPDGQKILALTPISAEGVAASLTVIVNWEATF